MAVKVAINGFGRIGRLAFRQLIPKKSFKIKVFTASIKLRRLHLLS